MNAYLKQRLELKNGATKERKAAINRVSPKRKEEEKEYLKLRDKFLKNKKCVYKGCKAPARDVHHAAGRVGKNYLAVATWLPVCRAHHVWFELNPKFAKELGYSKSRLTK